MSIVHKLTHTQRKFDVTLEWERTPRLLIRSQQFHYHHGTWRTPILPPSKKEHWHRTTSFFVNTKHFQTGVARVPGQRPKEESRVPMLEFPEDHTAKGLVVVLIIRRVVLSLDRARSYAIFIAGKLSGETIGRRFGVSCWIRRRVAANLVVLSIRV